MCKTLLIRTNEIDPYLQLGWWNIDNIPDLKELKFIFAHNGEGICTGAYEIKAKSWVNPKTGEYADIIIPYTIKVDRIYKKDKNGNEIIKTAKRVNFFEYTFIREDLKNIKIPKTKQGQGYPLQVVDFDEITNKIIINKTSRQYKIYDWSKNFKSGDVLWFYQLDSCFTTKNYIPIKIIIDDPINRSIKVNGNAFDSVGNYVHTALSSFIKMSKKHNRQMLLNCLNWVISDNEKQNVDKLMKNNPDNINIRQYIKKHSSSELGENFI